MAEHAVSDAYGSPHLKEQEEETIAIVGLLHDICKANCYVRQPKNQKVYDPEKVAAADAWQVKHDSAGSYIWETVMHRKILAYCTAAELFHEELQALAKASTA